MSTPAIRVNGLKFGANDNTVHAVAFGCVGDDSTDNLTSLNAAIAAAQANNATMMLPAGIYRVSAPLTTGTASFSILGAGFNSTIIKATGAMSSVFAFPDAGIGYMDFRDFTVNGNSLAQSAFKGNSVYHATWFRVRVIGTTTRAFDLSYGWDLSLIENEIFSNAGDGIYFGIGTGGNVENINGPNVIGNKIFSNGGWGVRMYGGTTGARIQGNTIETNAFGGIFLERRSWGINIIGNYFESNAATGYVVTNPSSLTVKAHILVDGTDGVLAKLANLDPAKAVVIQSNYVITATGGNADQFVWLQAGHDVVVANNYGYDLANAIPAVKFMSDTRYVAFKNFRVENNYGFSSDLAVLSWTANQSPDISTWQYTNAAARDNFFSQDVAQLANILVSGGGSLARSANQHEGWEGFDLTGAVATDAFGITLDTTVRPELANQVMYIGAYIKASISTAGGVLYSNGTLSNTYDVAVGTTAGDTAWHYHTLAFQMPASGTVKVGFQKGSGLAGDTVSFSHVVVAAAGVPYAGFAFGRSLIVPTLNGATADGAIAIDLSGSTGAFKFPTGGIANAPIIGAGLTASGAVANDFSGSTGAFKTSTGVNTFGGSSNAFTNTVAVGAGAGTVSAKVYDNDGSNLSVGTGSAAKVILAKTTTAVQVSGGYIGHRTGVADANYTVLVGDYVIAYSSLTAGRTVTLPGAAPAGTIYVIKNETAGAFAITIQAASGTIDGAASVATTAAAHAPAVRVYSDGVNYNTF